MSAESGSRDYGRFDALAEEFAERYRRGGFATSCLVSGFRAASRGEAASRGQASGGFGGSGGFGVTRIRAVKSGFCQGRVRTGRTPSP
jgi:hypothetical protein